MKIRIRLVMSTITLLISLSAAYTEVEGANTPPVDIAEMQKLSWSQKATGVWSATVGKPEDTTYLSYAGAPPKVNTLEEMPQVSFPLDKNLIRATTYNNRTIARIPLNSDEKLYGLGLQFKGINRRGQIYHMRTDHYSKGNERLHAPVPLYISSDGYAVLFNSPRFISIYAGVGNRKDSPNFPTPRDRNTDRGWQAQPDSDAVEASVIADGMEILVFAGPSPLDAIRRYNLYCGGGSRPPKWGLGFWHRMRTNASDDEVKQEIADYDKRNFPLDVIGLEPGWHSKSYPCTYEWNPKLFPDPKGFVSDMTDAGIKINLWENPYVSPDASIYEQIKPLSGSHTVWLGIVPDFTLEKTRQILTKQHETEHIDIGVSGYKIDEVDGYDFWLWPDHAIFPSGTSAEQMRQTYALQIQKMLSDVFHKRNLRTYSQIRASNAGASAYPFVIYTDHYDHRDFITALVNSGFCGVLYTPEIRSASSNEEWVRRMQSVCFSPLMQLNGWASNTKPWSFPDVEDEIREIIKLRISLLPYIYTTFAEYHFLGTPPIRPMVLEPGYNDKQTIVAGDLDDSKNPYAMAVKKDVSDQFMFGKSLLAAPVFTGQKSRQVILPAGKWYDFYTGEFAGGGNVITVTPPLDKIPLYVKDGGIIPMMPATHRISKLNKNIPLEVRHYGKSPATAMLYDDDGKSYDYENGKFSWQKLEVVKQDDGVLTGKISGTKGSYLSNYATANWVFMTK